MPAKVVLKVLSGPIEGSEFSFTEHDTFLFGRKRSCHARLPDDGRVSRFHFLLEVNPPDARLRDLGSLNGTYVNDVKYGGRSPDEPAESARDRQHPEVQLHSHDRIQVGDTILQVEVFLPLYCNRCNAELDGLRAVPAPDDSGTVKDADPVLCPACEALVRGPATSSSWRPLPPSGPGGATPPPRQIPVLTPVESSDQIPLIRTHDRPEPAARHSAVESARSEAATEPPGTRPIPAPARRSDFNAAAGAPRAAGRVATIRCEQCGRDVTDELSAGRRGDYLCERCRQRLLHESSPPATPSGNVSRVPPFLERLGGQIPGYDFGNELGKGTSSVVYLARRQTDGVQVAIKIMLAKVAVSEYARRAFLREIEVVRDLHHPNLVGMHEHGSAGSTFYIVFDYCNGGSLKDFARNQGGRLPVEKAVPLLLDCARALEYAHAKQIVHRDLKPDNVLLQMTAGRAVAKVADFGLAKSFAATGLSGMTATGEIGGTPAFMPRDQLTNFKSVKPSSDVWSLAATFYYALTGSYVLDFRNQDPIQVILTQEPPPILERAPGIPKQLAKVLDRALLTRIRSRYRDGGEFRAALEKAVRRI